MGLLSNKTVAFQSSGDPADLLNSSLEHVFAVRADTLPPNLPKSTSAVRSPMPPLGEEQEAFAVFAESWAVK